MPLATFKATAGTIKEPQNTKSTESCWTDTDHVHFPEKTDIRSLPAYTAAAFGTGSVTMTGTCRAEWAGRIGVAASPYYVFGTHYGLYAAYLGVLYNITPLKTVSVAAANSIATTNVGTSTQKKTITVTSAAHGQAVGDRVKISGAAATGGIPSLSINKEHIITAVATNTFSVLTDTEATSTVAAGGAAGTVYFKQIAAGNENQTLGVGLGFGTLGFGVWGAPFYSATAQSYPRIWSFDALGSELVMCAGDYLAGDGQKLYIWDGNLNVAPTVLLNAPTNCKWVKVVNNSVVALCDTTIKISELGNGTVWSGATYTAIDVQRAWSLISAFGTSEKAAVIFAPEPYLLRFVGNEWDLVELGQQYPIVAPAAACSLNDGLIWYGADGNMYFFDGGAVRTINNTQNGDYIRRNFNNAKAWHCFMMTDYKYSQAYLYYPSIGQTNPDSYMIFNPKQPSFTLGTMSRTSAQRNAEVDSTFYMTNGADVYRHFLVSPPTFNWSARSAFFYTDNGDYRVRVNRIYPDAQISQDVNFKIIGKEYPQSIEADYGNQTLTTASQALTVTGAGRLLSVEFSGSGDFMLNNLKMEMQVQGRNS
jgi:hypothetical protein